MSGHLFQWAGTIEVLRSGDEPDFGNRSGDHWSKLGALSVFQGQQVFHHAAQVRGARHAAKGIVNLEVKTIELVVVFAALRVWTILFLRETGHLALRGWK